MTPRWRPRCSAAGSGAFRYGSAGYVALEAGEVTALVIAPAYGRITALGTESTFHIHARNLTQSLHLTAHAERDSYNDLGEGMPQALLGDLDVDGLGTCLGRAGLEVRGGCWSAPRGRRRVDRTASAQRVVGHLLSHPGLFAARRPS